MAGKMAIPSEGEREKEIMQKTVDGGMKDKHRKRSLEEKKYDENVLFIII